MIFTLSKGARRMLIAGAVVLGWGCSQSSNNAPPGGQNPGDGGPGDDQSSQKDAGLSSDTGVVSVVTNRYDNIRSGANMAESKLTAANVNAQGFGLLFKRTVVGQIYAQPLYLPSLTLPDGSKHNVVYVATAHNDVYAFDADDPAQANPLWHKNLGPAGSTSGFGCKDMQPEVGIISTPVIDAAAGVMFVVAKSLEGTNWAQRIHALDVRTGNERPGSPVEISAQVPGTGDGAVNGNVAFNPQNNLNRPGLLLHQGALYMAFASHCDKSPYHGWVLAYTYDGTRLSQRTVYNVSPNGKQGGIWQAGVGLSAQGDNLYFAVGNGSTNPAPGSLDVSEGVVRLRASDLTLQDYWIPTNYKNLNAADADLSSGAILLPHDRLLTGSKDGQLYVLDTNNLSKYNADKDHILQTFTTPGKASGANGHLHGGPIDYQIPGKDEVVFVWPEAGQLLSYRMDPKTFLLDPTPTQGTAAKTPPGHPGGILTLSANGSAPGTGIVWASTSADGGDGAWHGTTAGILYAIDAADVTHLLWSSEQNASRDGVGNFAKFTPPTVVNGHVYLATFSNALNVYGLLH